MIDNANYNWDAERFFGVLTAKNRLAKSLGFVFCRVSGLEGFEEVLQQATSEVAFVCVRNEDDGFMSLENSPHTRRVKTVFLAMRHAIDRMDLRAECFEKMREIFRQFMSKLILERTQLQERNIYLDPRISFNEIDRYFASGCACAYFQIAVDVYTDIRYNNDEWEDDAESVFSAQFSKVYG